jgi:hypothetical protein
MQLHAKLAKMKYVFTFQTAITVLGLSLLSACGGSSTGNTAAIGFYDHGRMIDRIIAIPGTAFPRVPQSGSATFTGISQVAMFGTDGRRALQAKGNANLTLTFDGLELSGELSQFQVEGPSGLIAYEGDIAVLARATNYNRPNVGLVRYEGELIGDDGNTVRLGSGFKNFRLLGTPVRALTTLNDSGALPLQLLNTQRLATDVIFWADRD